MLASGNQGAQGPAGTPPGSPASSTARRLTGLPTFRALQEPNFRRLWISLSVSAVGTWMQIVALSLLVLDLTDGSALALGTVSLAQALSFLLLAPAGGAFADRFDRRRLLLVTQSIMMGLALLLGALTATGAIRFWMIPLVALFGSAALSFDQPARNALIASLVSKENLMNALALQSAVFNGASILGPALAGLALSRIGYSGNFFLNAASYVAVLVALAALPSPAAAGASKPGEGWFESFREAVHYIRRDAVLPSTVLAYGVLLFFGPSAAMMLPLFARQVIHAGPAQLGVLFSAVGVGAVFGALIVASLGDFSRKRPLAIGSVLVCAVALALFALCGTLHVSLPTLLVLGGAQNAAGATTITLLQTRVPPRMRGRAMSLNTLLIMGIRPLGDFPVGAVMARLGFRPAVLLSAAIVGIAPLALLLTRPAVRSPDPESSLAGGV
jgi:MFS family permease